MKPVTRFSKQFGSFVSSSLTGEKAGFLPAQMELLGGPTAETFQGVLEIRHAEFHKHYPIGGIDPKEYGLLERLSDRVNDLTKEVALLKQGSTIRADEPSELAQRFAEFAGKWRRETAVLSNVHRIILHPAYQRIIGLGPDAVPLILKELSQRSGHWFWALHAITGEDPVTSGATFKEAVDTWLNWGRAKGYV